LQATPDFGLSRWLDLRLGELRTQRVDEALERFGLEVVVSCGGSRREMGDGLDLIGIERFAVFVRSVACDSHELTTDDDWQREHGPTRPRRDARLAPGAFVQPAGEKASQTTSAGGALTAALGFLTSPSLPVVRAVFSVGPPGLEAKPHNVQTVEHIRVLDEATIAQIAAGEVIERPLSVVKELVENSLDAGASYVAVELTGGGRREIAVADDGRGIAHDDLTLALQRHATSKLAAADELFAVRTLGFRGEGLASIAAAAGSMDIVSRASGQNFGARIAVRHGTAGAVARVAASPGTKVTVRDLFAATPVRRDFLGSEKAEFGRVSAFLSRLALGWPKVAFSLRHDGRDVWSLPAVLDPVDRLEMVFGKGSRGSLALVRTSPNIMIGIAGFTSRIGADRPNRQGQVLFVNGRLVRSAALSAAWSTAYAGKMMSGRYPYGVLLISLPPGDVDVNVHPTKIEVRFASAAAVFDAVRHAVADALRDEQGSDGFESLAAAASHTASSPSDPSASLPAISLLDVGLAAPTAQSQTARALGQIDQTFIVISDPTGILILDQHAAHERIAFEALEDGQSAAASAPLLLPRIVELTPDQAATLAAYEAELAAIGVEIERFGDDAYRISAVPSGYEQRRFDVMGMLDDLAGEPASASSTSQASLGEARRRLLATVACHSVVRAHEPLSLQEQVTLYDRLRHCRDPQTCPHGRPTMLRLDALELAKAFKRI
jgi:DNA mismatch repair protein MutL